MLKITNNPRASTRQLAIEMNLPRMKIHRTLRSRGYKPYRIHVSQALRPGDTERRLHYCNWLQQRLMENDDFLNNIIWTDESSFSTNGMFNRNNEHYWHTENPRQNQEVRLQGRHSFNVWIGMFRNRIIGPFIYEHRLTSERYLNLIRTDVLNALEDEPLAVLQNLWWQQDGAPPHNGRIVTDYLNNIFPNKWIGNRGFVHWPARSPDLTPLDYFLWGYIKNRLYKHTPQDIQVLRQNLIREVRAIPARTIQRAIFRMPRIIRKCIEVNGQLFEYLF